MIRDGNAMSQFDDKSCAFSQKRRFPTDLTGLIFRIAHTDLEREAVIDCRWKGYKKYFHSREQCKDKYDERAVLYMCLDAVSGDVLGCLRVVSRLKSRLELEEYFDISSLVKNGLVVAEVSRFSIPKSRQSPSIKLGLWKLLYLDSIRKGYTHLIVWVKRSARRNYEYLFFEDYPRQNTFVHTVLHGLTHYVMTFDIANSTQKYRSSHHPLYTFFCEKDHSQIVLD